MVLKAVACESTPVLSEELVLLIDVQLLKGLVALSHLNTLPVFPLRFNVGPLLPVQIGDPAPVIDPETV